MRVIKSLLLLICLMGFSLTGNSQYSSPNDDYCFDCPFFSCDWCELVDDDPFSNTLDPEEYGSGCTEKGRVQTAIWTGDWMSLPEANIDRFKQILRNLSAAGATIKMKTSLNRHIDCSRTTSARAHLSTGGFFGDYSDRTMPTYMGGDHVFTSYILDFTLNVIGVQTWTYTWSEDRHHYFNL